MAVHAALLPSCSHVLQVQQQQPRLAARGGEVSLWNSRPVVECRGQTGGRGGGRSWRGGFSWTGMGVGPVTPSVSWAAAGRKSRTGGGVVRAEQEEVGTGTTTTSAPPPPPIELNTGGITEVDKDTFWPIVQSAGDKVVVLDMYTQWCGPCKLMLPKINELAEASDDVIFLKLDCNKHNKVLAQELGIKVVPTFKIFKKDKLLGEVKGAKFPDLVNAIESARNG